MTGEPLLQQQPRGSHSVVVVMTAGHFRELGEMVNYDQDASVITVGGADLQMIILDQFVELPALDVL